MNLKLNNNLSNSLANQGESLFDIKLKGGRKMKNKIFIFMILGMFIFSIAFSSALGNTNDNMTVKATILQSEISISVPNEILFQDITAGYLSERKDLDIDNTGTVDIEVTPQLPNYTGNIFDKLAFHEVLSDPLTQIEFFSFEIEKPSTVGGTRTAGIYMYLDLENYNEDIESEMLDHEAEVVFWAVPI